MDIKMRRKELFDIMQECRNGRQEQKRHLEEVLLERVGPVADEDIKSLKQNVSKFCYQAFKKLDQAGRSIERMRQTNDEWLNSEIIILKQKASADISGGGRPIVDFQASSERSKRRKTEVLRGSCSSEMLTYAATMKSRTEGKVERAELLKEIDQSPTRPKKMWRAWTDAQRSRCYSPEEALALFLDADLTRNQYQLLRNSAKSIGHDIYPSYHKILEEKRKCYPRGVHITTSVAEIPVQELLDHTAEQLVDVQKDVIISTSSSKFYLVSKWGCDGSSGHSIYKQRVDEEGFIDSHIFLSSLVPLQLHSDSPQQIIWQNRSPSSTMFCRPVRMQFKKETDEIASNEVAHIQKQVAELRPSKVSVDSREIEIHHKLQLTMVDGKICNAVTSTTSTQTCYVCGASPKEMNLLSRKKKVDTSTFIFGLSTLHAWIRFMEWLLHVAYRLPIQKWQVRGEDDKQKLATKKTEIQQRMKTEMGLMVDQPRSDGSGTSNDGNTARRFFDDPEKTANITGIDVGLIQKCAVILKTLSSGFAIDTNKFAAWCQDTAEHYVYLYPWYYMPASVHKVLMHGPDIISAALLPIGQMSEEAQEARHKHLKAYREHHSRKSSRQNTISDVFHRLLLTSDPKLSTLRQQFRTKKQRKCLSPEVLALLKVPEVTPADELQSSEDPSDSESD